MCEGVLFILITGATFVFARMAPDYVGPLTVLGPRYLLACLLLLSFVPHESSMPNKCVDIGPPR